MATQLAPIRTTPTSHAATTASTLELIEAHAAARGDTTDRRRVAVIGGHELGVSIGAGDRIELLARDGRLAVLATSQSAASRGIARIDELEIAIPARRACAQAVRALLHDTIARWPALYESFPHDALDELRRSEPKARLAIGLAQVSEHATPRVMYAATTCEPGREPLVWSADRGMFFAPPGMIVASPASDDPPWWSNANLGCDPGCFEVISLAELGCDVGCL